MADIHPNPKTDLSAARRVRFSGMALLVAICVPLLCFLLIPILLILPMAFNEGRILIFPPSGFSFDPFVDLLSDQSWMQSAWVSLKVGLLATCVATVVGVSAALALNKARAVIKGAITGIIMLPIMIPGIVMALGFYLFYRQSGVAGSWVPIAFAHAVVITPFVFLATQASLSGLDPTLPRAARSLGAGSLSVLWYVYLPALRPGILGGAIFAFIGSFDEIIISFFLAGPGVTPLPVQIFTSLQTDLTPKVAAVAAVLFFLSIIGLVVQAYQNQSVTRKPKAPLE